ncbi:MAG: hypothetical protein PHS84_10340 [Paludibacter sp.]|jgi:hypothetical protein|nr:hypothetical protein [Paludibacter sp.]
MKQNEFQSLILKFGFVNISKNVTKGYYKKVLNGRDRVEMVKKFKYKQCYITFNGTDIFISFNNPTYTYNTTNISIDEVQSLLYYLTIISNRKFSIKKENPDICKIHRYFEDKAKYYDSMSNREKKRYDLDMLEFNKIKDFTMQ